MCIETDVWDEVRRFVLENFESGHPAGTNDVLDFLASVFALHINADTLRKRIRGDHELRMVEAHPMERQRVECDPGEILQYARRLATSVNGTPAAFVFNLDESGFQEWADRRESKVVVPSGFRDDSIMVPVDRNVKRSSLLV
jgi:hypothetical protein